MSVGVLQPETNLFWHEDFEDVLVILTKSGKLDDVVTGEAPIERHRLPMQQSEPGATRRRVKPRTVQGAKVHREVDGAYTHNEMTKELHTLCQENQAAACPTGT